MREEIDEATGISTKVVIDWKQQPRKAPTCARASILRDDKGNAIKLRERARGALLPAGRTRSSRSRTARR